MLHRITLQDQPCDTIAWEGRVSRIYDVPIAAATPATARVWWLYPRLLCGIEQKDALTGERNLGYWGVHQISERILLSLYSGGARSSARDEEEETGPSFLLGGETWEK